jgi:hypothetical protein
MPLLVSVKHSECKQQICFHVSLHIFYYPDKTHEMTTNHASPFSSHHLCTNDFAVIKTHYKDGCTLSLNTTQGGTGHFSNNSVQMGYNAVQSVQSWLTFWKNTLPPLSWLNKLSKIPVWKQLASFSANSIMKMGAICSSETSVYFQQTTCIISQKIVLFIATAVKNSNPTNRYKVMHNMRSVEACAPIGSPENLCNWQIMSPSTLYTNRKSVSTKITFVMDCSNLLLFTPTSRSHLSLNGEIVALMTDFVYYL